MLGHRVVSLESASRGGFQGEGSTGVEVGEGEGLHSRPGLEVKMLALGG